MLNYYFKKVPLTVSFILALLISALSMPASADAKVTQNTKISEGKFTPLPSSILNRTAPKYLEKTFQLLSDANPETKRPVIILFYGQSITEQAWWKKVASNIQHNFPAADIVFYNRAIGAHTSDRLLKTAEADVYPLQPDLVIFHVYGNHHDYESIIKNIRNRTTADIVITSDHIEKYGDVNEETLPSNLSSHNSFNQLHNYLNKSSKKASWDAWKNYVFLPYISKQYGAELIDLRDRWKDYLRMNKIPASNLLLDNVHLNAQGEFVMSEIISSYFQPKFLGKKKDIEHEKLYLINQDLKLEDKKISMTCVGNRFDVLLKPEVANGQVKITIDGSLPSSNKSSYGFTRSSTYPNSNWPALLRVTSGSKPLIEELWTIKIKNANPDLTQFDFDLIGSKTGFDGTGSADKKFQSNSGRVIIEPDDWNLAFAMSVYKKPLPADFKVTWSAEFHGKNQLEINKNTAHEVRIAQDVINEKHTLQFVGSAIDSIRGIRCFN